MSSKENSLLKSSHFSFLLIMITNLNIIRATLQWWLEQIDVVEGPTRKTYLVKTNKLTTKRKSSRASLTNYM